jgi:tetratricopeptide (TPR) repeat protein
MSIQQPVTPAGVYLGVGVGVYDDTRYLPLPQAIRDTHDLGELLAGYGYETHLIDNPTSAEAAHLGRRLPKDMLAQGNRPLVVLWSGHGEPTTKSEGELKLVVKDTDHDSAPLHSAGWLAGVAARTGASQILLVLDTCYSGAGTINSAAVADQVLQELPPDSQKVWFGVLSSTQSWERARDGLFGERLLRLLRHGPKDPGLRRRWSDHNEGVRGDDLIITLLEEWGSDVQQPKMLITGRAQVMFPNPRHDPSARPRVVEHLLLAARGIDPGEGGFYFTGRTAQLDQIVAWLQAGRPGVLVVTGPAGSGKSAIVGRVVSLSNPDARAQILAQGSLDHSDPGEGSIAAHVHTRRLKTERLVESLDEQLVAAGVLPLRPSGHRNRGQLLGDLEQTGTCPAIVIDGLDEAGLEAPRIAEDVIRLLAGTTRILVGTRNLPTRNLPTPSGERSLVEALTPSETIDLGAEALQAETAADVRSYVTKRLAGSGESTMDAALVGGEVVRIARQQGEGLFLLARMVTAQLRGEPVDTTASGWEDQLAHSVKDALARDLDRIPPLQRDGHQLPHAARELLSALAWGYGAGIPDDVWPVIATALSSTNTHYQREDVYWVLGQAGRYIIEDGEDGRAVYRPAHQRLADPLRQQQDTARMLTGTAGRSSEERASQVALALVDYYQQLLDSGLSPTEPAYLWGNVSWHCADAGSIGIDALRRLVARDTDTFLPILAAALAGLGNRYTAKDFWNPEAVAPTEEAVGLYRELAATDPARVPDLAAALSDLYYRYAFRGREQEALAPMEEAARLLRKAAATDPALLPTLLRLLANLSIQYARWGWNQDAVAVTEEAVSLNRKAAATNPAFLPDLARRLDYLGMQYANRERNWEAVAVTKEAVGLYRELATTDPTFLPDLAAALNQLSDRYARRGRNQEAVAVTEEAVGLYRKAAATDPALLPTLLRLLADLSVQYANRGRDQEALAVTEEAVGLYPEAAATDPARLPDLLRVLADLSVQYANRGRDQEAVAVAEEAVGLRRQLATRDPELLPDLAAALIDLGIGYGELGRNQEAVAVAEEAVGLYREAAATDPAARPPLAVRAFLPNLAVALANLSAYYSQVGRRSAIDPLWDESIGSMADSRSKAFLLLRRAEGREVPDPSAVDDLLIAQRLIGSFDHALTADLHATCRSRRSQDPEAFDSRWQGDTAALPNWLLISEDIIDIMTRWIDTRPLATAKEFLVEHFDQLLGPWSDLALDEVALNKIGEEPRFKIGLKKWDFPITYVAGRKEPYHIGRLMDDPLMIKSHRHLLREVQRVGIDDAYRPWLALELLVKWLNASFEERQSMLQDPQTRGKLRGGDVADALGILRAKDPEETDFVVVDALLVLARADRDDAAFEALADPSRFPSILAGLARSNTDAVHGAMATLAIFTDASDVEHAAGCFHKAIELAIAGKPKKALKTAELARSLDAGQVTSWLGLLVELLPRHPNLIQLAQLLTDTDGGTR